LTDLDEAVDDRREPGLTLFHCHIQAHMDYGFKALFRYG
jgi:FtsP/CotA-like multicopper oxidase with cupredoxin domain